MLEIVDKALSKRRICRPPPSISEVAISAYKMRNILKRMKVIFQILPIFSFWVIDAKDVTIRLQEKNYSKVTKFTGKIGINLTMIFHTNDFSWAILSFWDIVGFINDFVHNFQVFWVIFGSKLSYISKYAQCSDRSFCIREFFLCNS